MNCPHGENIESGKHAPFDESVKEDFSYYFLEITNANLNLLSPLLSFGLN